MLKRRLDDAEAAESGDARRQNVEVTLAAMLPLLEVRMREHLEPCYGAARASPNSAISLERISLYYASEPNLMTSESRNRHQISFVNGILAHKLAVDATWRRRADTYTLTYPSAFVVNTLTSIKVSYIEHSFIPTDIYEWPHLRCLDLNVINNIVLPQSIANLRQLCSLSLVYCSPGDTILHCSALTTLQSLTLAHAGVDTDLSFMRQLHQLTYLQCSSCNVSRIPPILAALTNLEALVLHTNPIREFPWQMCVTLTRLRRLELDLCNLDTLPPEIDGLLCCALRTISLYQNPFSLLPSQLGRNSSVVSITGLNGWRIPHYAGERIAWWHSDSYMAALPRELQLMLHYYVTPPLLKPVKLTG